MSDGLYDWIANQDCLPRAGDNFEIELDDEAFNVLADLSIRLARDKLQQLLASAYSTYLVSCR